MDLTNTFGDRLRRIASARALPVPENEYQTTMRAVEALENYANEMSRNQRLRAGLAIMLSNIYDRILLERIAQALEQEDNRLGGLVLAVHVAIINYQDRLLAML